MGGFAETCKSFFVCPMLLCHDDEVVQDFLRTSCPSKLLLPASDVVAGQFVSMLNVQDETNEGGNCSPLRRSTGCIASLTLAQSQSTIGSPAEHVFRMLPNGDIRVIQSLPA